MTLKALVLIKQLQAELTVCNDNLLITCINYMQEKAKNTQYHCSLILPVIYNLYWYVQCIWFTGFIEIWQRKNDICTEIFSVNKKSHKYY